MLEMAEGIICLSTTVLKIANCVWSVHKVEEGSTVCNDTATEQPIWSKKE